MKSMLKDALILFVITLAAGILLGGVYQITKEPIEKQQVLALEKACREVFSQAASFSDREIPDAAETEQLLKENGYSGNTLESYQAAYDENGEKIGYVLTVVTHEGYAGDIRFTMGICNDGTINGISLLEIGETPGLGMRAQEVLVPQYAEKDGYPLTVTKMDAKKDTEIEAISGATVTSNALTNGVNTGIFYFNRILTQDVSDQKGGI